MPRFSVILPTFNRLRFLQQAINSVRAQTCDDWELVIADDGSGAGVRSWLRALESPRIRVVWLEHCGNPARVRNAALAEARGDFAAFLDSDDLWAPRKLAVQLASLEASGVRWSYTACDRIDADGCAISEPPRAARVPIDGDIFRPLLAMELAIAMPSVVAERALLAEIGGFDEAQRFGEFHDLCLRLALRAPVAGVREALCSVRSHDEHYSADRLGAHADWVRLYDKMLALAPTPALRSLGDRMRARMAVRLAHSRGVRHDPQAAWEALRAGAVFSWRHASLWPSGAAALARSFAPGTAA